MKRSIVLGAFVVIAFFAHAQSKKATVSKESMERGKVLYEQYCLACHQADGSGVPNLNPPLIRTKWTTGDKKEIVDILLKGLDQEIEIGGETFNNVMPPFSYLSDQEIADVATFVRNSFSNGASAVTAPDVKAARASLK